MTGIHWLEQRAGDLPGSMEWLSPAETARLHSFRFPKRRDEWRLGRWTAKRAVAVFLKLSCAPGGLAVVEIRTAPSGAPQVFIGGAPAPVSISLSHRGQIALCAVAGPADPIGCDLELIEPRGPEFLTDYFTSEEQALLASAESAERDRLATLLWSIKESVLKVVTVGLRAPTQGVCVTHLAAADASRWRSFQARAAAGGCFQGWWREAGNMVRTLAIRESAK